MKTELKCKHCGEEIIKSTATYTGYEHKTLRHSNTCSRTADPAETPQEVVLIKDQPIKYPAWVTDGKEWAFALIYYSEQGVSIPNCIKLNGDYRSLTFDKSVIGWLPLDLTPPPLPQPQTSRLPIVPPPTPQFVQWDSPGEMPVNDWFTFDNGETWEKVASISLTVKINDGPIFFTTQGTYSLRRLFETALHSPTADRKDIMICGKEKLV